MILSFVSRGFWGLLKCYVSSVTFEFQVLIIIAREDNVNMYKFEDRISERSSPLLENKENSRHDQRKANKIVPPQVFFQIKDGKDAEHSKGNDFLDRLELSGREHAVPDTIGRNLETIFKERDAPADQNDNEKRRAFVFQVAVPRKSHKDIGNC
jgi:hypothetical protein